MGSLLGFDVGDGNSILVEVDDVGGPVMRGGRAGDVVTKAGESLEELLGRVGPAVRGIVTQLRETAEWPGEVQLEFSVKLTAESGVVIAKTGGEANFKIVMRWTQASG